MGPTGWSYGDQIAAARRRGNHDYANALDAERDRKQEASLRQMRALVVPKRTDETGQNLHPTTPPSGPSA